MKRLKIGDRIRLMRALRRISAMELGVSLGVSQSTISRWELNQTVPPGCVSTMLAGALGITVSQLRGLRPLPIGGKKI